MTQETQLKEGQRVRCTNGDDVSMGTIDGVHDHDQGDFEYYVQHDDGRGSFWPRECLEPVEDQ